MKKLFLIAAMTVMLGSVGTAFATETTKSITGENGTTKITYTKDSSYTIVIPGDFTLSATETNKQVFAEGAILNDGEELNVIISSTNYDNNWYVKSEAGDKYIYTIKKGTTKDSVANNSVILTVEAGNTDKVVTDLYFQLNDTVKKAGEYSDTLTFTVSVDEPGQTPS